MNYYWRLIHAGIRPDCAEETIVYYTNYRTREELDAYVRSVEERREVSDR